MLDIFYPDEECIVEDIDDIANMLECSLVACSLLDEQD